MTAIIFRPLEQRDHADWKRLWSDYITFYESTLDERVYASTWARLFQDGEFEPRGFIALKDGKAVGLVHYIFHRSCWSVEGNCYLQDLFTAPDARGKGVGEGLIEAVRNAAAKRSVSNVYWMTQETNATARRLYDRVAKNSGFIIYGPA